MNWILRDVLLVAVLIYFIMVIWLLKKNRLALRYTLMWLLGGILMLLVLAFPVAWQHLMTKMGIVEFVNGVFAAVLFLIMVVLMMLTSIVSDLNSKNRKIVQNMALYEKRIRDLEAQLEEKNGKNEDDK